MGGVGAGAGVEEEEEQGDGGRRRQTVLSLSQRDEINYQTLKLDFQRFLSRHGLSDSTQSLLLLPFLLLLLLLLSHLLVVAHLACRGAQEGREWRAKSEKCANSFGLN